MDDLADLARLIRTSRVLYYMTLPQLYQAVTLRSYPNIRRVNGRVEGLGGGSPICMALGALSTGSCAALVRHFCVTGAWDETLEYMQGRIPDVSMLLSIVGRNALDRMTSVQSLRYACLQTARSRIQSLSKLLLDRPRLAAFLPYHFLDAALR